MSASDLGLHYLVYSTWLLMLALSQTDPGVSSYFSEERIGHDRRDPPTPSWPHVDVAWKSAHFKTPMDSDISSYGGLRLIMNSVRMSDNLSNQSNTIVVVVLKLYG